MKVLELQSEIKTLANPKKAKLLQGFFKTKKGEYGEGDVFLGLTVPVQRKLVKKYAGSLDLKDLDKLLKSKIHEHRLIALLVLVTKFQSISRRHFELACPVVRRFIGHTTGVSGSKNRFRPPKAEGMNQKDIFDFYLSRTQYINNWDLVDLSAPKIVGAYLRDKNKNILYKLAKSKNLWERRIAILATFDDIYFRKPEDALKISKILLNDHHDLIHKAVGWMLREVGKRCNEKYLLKFLDDHYKSMPRTMLRYAIERLPEPKRQHYLS